MLRLVLLLAFLVAPQLPASAQDYKGWGVSAGLGVSQIRDRDSDGTFEGNGFGFTVNFEYRFTQNFALGFGGFSLGSADDVVNDMELELDVDGFDLFARFIYPVSDRIDFYGRLGTASYTVETDPPSFTDLFGDDAFEIGLGLDFARKEGFALRTEGIFYKGSSNESGGLLTFGFSYKF